MRQIEFKPSFDRLYRKLDLFKKQKIDEAIGALLTALENNEMPRGLGLKRLKGDIWEIRLDLSLRVGFRMKKDLIEFGTAGNHETIKRFLKNQT